jgi:hydrogenase expression/formation protein HypD
MAMINETVLPEKVVRNYAGPPLRIMEVCGTHTHEIFRLGIRNIIPDNIKLISGPGCPVCVTPNGFIDEALILALEYGATICTFGDLVRVPGSKTNLAGARAKGAKIQIVYSPLDAVDYAIQHKNEKVVFLSVGFETTIPASCLAVKNARKAKITNFTLLTANKTMTNAYRMLSDSADAFLYPGHVSVITGTEIYDQLKLEGISGAVTGFTSGEILTALAVIIKKISEKNTFAVNCYTRVVTSEGNPAAKKLISEVMTESDAVWRGLGVIKNSGLRLGRDYEKYDSRLQFKLPEVTGKENPLCRCGDILKGNIKPCECSLFGKGCTPDHPIGACMVSSEGTCSAYYKYTELI